MDVADQMLKQDADNRLWKINYPEKAAQVRTPYVTNYANLCNVWCLHTVVHMGLDE